MTKTQLKLRASKITNDFKTMMGQKDALEKKLEIIRTLVIKVIPLGSTFNGVLHFQEDRIFLDMAAAKALGLERKLTKPEQDTRACRVYEEEMIANEDPNAKKLFSHEKTSKLIRRR